MKYWRMTASTIIAFNLCSVITATQAQQDLSRIQGTPVPESTLPILGSGMMVKTEDSSRLSKIGDDMAKHGKWQEAARLYQQALQLWSNNQDALYGLAGHSHIIGDKKAEVAYYRKAIYVDKPEGMVLQEGRVDKLMKYAIALARAGQAEEAITVYHEGLRRLNRGGSGAEPIPLMLTFSIGNPQLGQFSNYTPAKLEAAARLALAIETTDQKEELEQIQQAITLQPNWALAHFYLGFAQRHSNPKAMDAEFDKALALSLGGTEMSEVVAEIRKKGFVAKPKWPTDPNNIRNQKPTNLSDRDGSGVGH